MRLTKFALLTFAFCFLLASLTVCSSDSDSTIRPSPIDDTASLPTVIAVGDHSYRLETYLWRDFMPIAPPDGQPLVALARLVEVDSLAIPAGVELSYLWVYYQGDVWATPFVDPPVAGTPPYIIERAARNGPKWGPGVKVDVVLEFITPGKIPHLVLAKEQFVNRTD
jgi:hypothetical protein